eukprot:s238_g26.t1
MHDLFGFNFANWAKFLGIFLNGHLMHWCGFARLCIETRQNWRRKCRKKCHSTRALELSMEELLQLHAATSLARLRKAMTSSGLGTLCQQFLEAMARWKGDTLELEKLSRLDGEGRHHGGHEVKGWERDEWSLASLIKLVKSRCLK